MRGIDWCMSKHLRGNDEEEDDLVMPLLGTVHAGTCMLVGGGWLEEDAPPLDGGSQRSLLDDAASPEAVLM